METAILPKIVFIKERDTTVDDRNPARPYVDLTYQQHRNSGKIIHIYTYEVMQDFFHEQYS